MTTKNGTKTATVNPVVLPIDPMVELLVSKINALDPNLDISYLNKGNISRNFGDISLTDVNDNLTVDQLLELVAIATNNKKQREITDKEAQKIKMVSTSIRHNVKTDDIDFIDYLPSKLVSGCMLILEGKRIDHNLPVGLSAVGRVHLKLANIECHIANVFEKSVVLTTDALALPDKTNDALTVDDLVSFKDEIGKQWCLSVKSQRLANKTAKEAATKQKRIDRRSALIEALRKN